MGTKIKQKSLVISIYQDAHVIFHIDEIQYNTSLTRLKTLESKLLGKVLQAADKFEFIKITKEEADKLIEISFQTLPKQDFELSPIEMYRKEIKNAAKDESFPRPSKKPPHNILWIKAVGCEIIENEFNEDSVYTFKDGDKFGFSESYVNKLIEIAYLCGKKENKNVINKDIAKLKEKLIQDFKNIINTLNF